MPAILPPNFLETIGYQIQDYYINPGDPAHLNRANRPVLDKIRSLMKTSPAINNQLGIKVLNDSELEMEFFNDLDPLSHEEINLGYDMIFDFSQHHMGLKIRHQKFRDAGFKIIPNAMRKGKGDFRIHAKTDRLRLVNMVEAEFDELMDAYDRREDYYLHVGRSFNANAMTGIADLIPYTIAAGSEYAGQPWNTPGLTRQVKIDQKFDGTEDAAQEINGLMRKATTNAQEVGGTLDFAFAGGEWLDRWVAYCKAEGIDWQAHVNERVTSTDRVIQDAAVIVAGKKVIHDPTLDKISDETGDTTWSRTLHIWNSKTWEYHHPEGEHKQFSAGMDPITQRFSRYSLEGRTCLVNRYPAGNILHTFAQTN